ncbi:MAG: IS110 family transposase, partial [Rhodobacteraceae bacterium]|nr:IS110 family transposase [Paracoccaceae bacterium]
MKLFVGMDGSLAKIAIRASGEHSEIVEEAGAASEPDVLARWPGEMAKGLRG